MGKKDSDYQDDMVIKELNRYRSLLDGFMKFRKSKNDSVISATNVVIKAQSAQRNGMSESNSKTTT
jgi:hypothetical protein